MCIYIYHVSRRNGFKPSRCVLKLLSHITIDYSNRPIYIYPGHPKPILTKVFLSKTILDFAEMVFAHSRSFTVHACTTYICL